MKDRRSTMSTAGTGQCSGGLGRVVASGPTRVSVTLSALGQCRDHGQCRAQSVRVYFLPDAGGRCVEIFSATLGASAAAQVAGDVGVEIVVNGPGRLFAVLYGPLGGLWESRTDVRPGDISAT